MRCPHLHRSRRSNSSAALVIALAFIVIITGLVTFFLTYSLLEMQVSKASAGQTEAALFARGAVDSVISEFKQEITAGSWTNFYPSGSDQRDPNCFFMPLTNLTMVPYQMTNSLGETVAPNVLKWSAYNYPFYIPPKGSNTKVYNTTLWPAPSWASSYCTTNVDNSGRTISLNRWNEPLLMPTANPGVTNLTPTNSFNPPDWIYMTRAAGPVTNGWSSTLIANTTSGAFNTNRVVGRFAYVVYDEGGLLDVNAAGYDPANVTTNMVRNKISEACADLTQIGLNTSDITALVTWRNPINDASGTAYTNYIYTPNTNAFLTPAAGERMFTSRQQLIDFLTQNVAQSSTDVERMQAALPYLTTFSRELNAPSWYPPPLTPGALIGQYAYYKNSTNAANIDTSAVATNIFAPLARELSATYTDGANNLTIQTNQPVAFARFPLSRLAWLGTNGPVLGTNGLSSTPTTAATQVQQSFGLVWDSSNNSTNCAWIYAGPSGSTATNAIQTLGTITSREPNFFELLKAGILIGAVNATPAEQTGSIPAPGAIDPRYSNTDQQIMQIGLSAIDQASSAALPTRIEFGSNTTGDWNGPLYGSKPLPYIYKMVFSPYRPTAMPPDGTYTQEYFTAWEEPVFWNPYQTLTTNTNPLQIRIRADGTNNGAYGNMGSDTDAADASPGGTNNLYVSSLPEVPCGPSGPSTQAGGANGATIELDGTSAAAFNSTVANPVTLYSLSTNGFTPKFNDLRADNPAIWPTQANADIYTEGGCTYMGFWLGAALAPDQPDPNYATKGDVVGGTYEPYQQAEFYSGPSGHRSTQQFVLEVNYGTTASPNWQEVQRMRFDTTTSHSNDVEEEDNFTVLQRRLDFQTFNDPRTGRFSFDLMQLQDYLASAASYVPVTQTDINAVTWTTFPALTNNYFTGLIKYVPVTGTIIMNPSWAAGAAAPGIDSFRYADNTGAGGGAPSTTPNYDDSDGLQRQADGWWNNASANTLPMRQDTPSTYPAGSYPYLPVFLGRPFQSVGELGYVYRDMPWRSLNFSSVTNTDAGVLDYFCINDGYAGITNAPLVGGVIDLNTQNQPVLQAMLNGAARAQLFTNYDVNASDAATIAQTITNITYAEPLLNKAELATRVAPNDPTVMTTATSEPGIDTNIKERREVIVRALASAGQVRTWNLLIDVIAQTGQFPPGSTGFNNFNVTAEQRYWAHVAIDRYTGQVISLQLEPVSE
ncbi:MAG: hypothetical protein LV481_15465 [Methylacidiphilales bacterium]|nr:hypothetical protein [Candidatus Methylacidiphilales bacterium]